MIVLCAGRLAVALVRDDKLQIFLMRFVFNLTQVNGEAYQKKP